MASGEKAAQPWEETLTDTSGVLEGMVAAVREAGDSALDLQVSVGAVYVSIAINVYINGNLRLSLHRNAFIRSYGIRVTGASIFMHDDGRK